MKNKFTGIRFICLVFTVGLTFLIVAPGGLLYDAFGEEYTFDMWRGEISIDFSGSEPMTLEIQGGVDGTVITQVKSGKYKNLTQLESKGGFTFFEHADVSNLLVSTLGEDGSTVTKTLTEYLENLMYVTSDTKHELVYNSGPGKLGSQVALERGQIISETQTDKQHSMVSLVGEINSAESVINYPEGGAGAQNKGDEEDKFRTEAYTSKSPSGLLVLNATLPNPPSPGSSREQIARELGVSLGEARELIDQYGVLRIKNAVSQATKFTNGRQNGNPQPAGGAGAIAEGIIPTKTLADQLPISKLQLYLEGPEYDGVLRDSTLYLRIFHPKTPQKISDMPSVISVHGTGTQNGKKGILLLDSFIFNEENDYYQYAFEPDKWLVNVDDITPGPYVLSIDFSNARHLKLPITITEGKKVIPRS